MEPDHVGFLEFDGKVFRFAAAKCWFGAGQLGVEAKGPQCRLKLRGIPFPGAATIADLAGRAFGPDSETVLNDPIAEGGIETRNLWLSFLRLEVSCRAYDADAHLITVIAQGEIVDNDSGSGGAFDSSLRCSIVKSTR